jgi:histidine triad (HIT) family protein
MSDACIFCNIGAGRMPVAAVYDDDEFLAFPDNSPQAPIHVLLIPKEHYATILDVQDVEYLGRLMRAVQVTADRLGLTEDGFRTVINSRDNGGQTVHHLHVHILGGRFMQWPPG